MSVKDKKLAININPPIAFWKVSEDTKSYLPLNEIFTPKVV